MMSAPRRRGFTLVEMLVVIGIIVVLMAILFPVFAIVRTKAKETQCKGNLHQLAVALKQYRADHGRYPGPPWYEASATPGSPGRYHGGFSDLYPDYVDDSKLLICPMDPVARRVGSQVKDCAYCSYNGKTNAPSNWDFTEIYYNYNGYDGGAVGGSGQAQQPCNSTGIDNGGGTAEAGYIAALLSDYQGAGRTLRDAPRLINRQAPGNTIITHCTSHRGSTPASANARDFIISLDGRGETIFHTQWDEDPDGAGLKVSRWIGQIY